MIDNYVHFNNIQKLESYDRIHVISELLKASTPLELEFFNTVVEGILKFHKHSYAALKTEINNEFLMPNISTSESIDEHVRLKLITSLTFLNESNYVGAEKIYEFLRNNVEKFKELIKSNTNAYEEVLLIYQLANEHPAFNIDHCQEICDYLTEIRSIENFKCQEVRLEGYISDIEVLSISNDDNQKYVYKIKVKISDQDVIICRTLEDIYKFYKRIFLMFQEEVTRGEICELKMSFIDNHEISKNLIQEFFTRFLNSPSHVLRCDFVQNFFHPTDQDLLNSSTESCKFMGPPDWSYSQTNDDDDDDCSSLNPSCSSLSCTKVDQSELTTSISDDENTISTLNIPARVQSLSENTIEYPSHAKSNKMKKTRQVHSSGSSPIRTPSEDSQSSNKSCKKFDDNSSTSSNSSSDCWSNSAHRTHFNLDSADSNSRTENWLSHSTTTISENDEVETPVSTFPPSSNSLTDNPFFPPTRTSTDPNFLNKYNHYKIYNLHQWLRGLRLHKYFKNLEGLTFGKLRSMTDAEDFIKLGLANGAAKKLIGYIQSLSLSSVTSDTSSHGDYICLHVEDNTPGSTDNDENDKMNLLDDIDKTPVKEGNVPRSNNSSSSGACTINKWKIQDHGSIAQQLRMSLPNNKRSTVDNGQSKSKKSDAEKKPKT